MKLSSATKTTAGLLLLTALALFVHGYHLGVEDQAVYLPAIKKALNPQLYPHDSQFFLTQTAPTVFPQLMALLKKASHLPLPVAVFAVQLIFILLLLYASLRLARRCFASPETQWSAVTTVAALLALPIGATALTLVDNYLHPRLIATVFLLFMLECVLLRRWIAALLWLVVAAAFHIQMAFYGALLAMFFIVPERWVIPRGRQISAPATSAFFPLKSLFEPASSAWREAARTRSHFHYLRYWKWYEWLGIIGPLIFFCYLRKLAARKNLHRVRELSSRLVSYGIFIIVAAIIITVPPQFERLTPYQPMRGFHLLYFFFFLFAGGLLAEFVLRRKPLRWLILFMPICFGMFYTERAEFPASPHIEWPRAKAKNPWLEAFDWIKSNTPVDAYFALDPMYNDRPQEDVHGFRAFADRSMMADYVKDSGVALLFPAIAPEWQREVHALDGWQHFSPEDFARLHREFKVDWVVIEQSQPSAQKLDCPYQNELLRVCKIP